MVLLESLFLTGVAMLLTCGADRLQQFPQYNRGECLEEASCDYSTPYWTYDGSCSSAGHPSWGRAGNPFIRTEPAIYADGVSSVRLSVDNQTLPNARLISSILFRGKGIPDEIHTHSVMSWGQLIAHDFTEKRLAFASITRPCCTSDFQMLPTESLPEDCIPVEVPSDDYFYSNHNVRCLSFYRATAMNATGCEHYPREQINNISHVIDGSMLYGSEEKTARLMRSLTNGKLKVDKTKDGSSFLTNDTDPSKDCSNPPSEKKCFFAGDQRVNQNVGLVVLTTALLRLHNYLCDQMVHINPHWDDEKIYQEVRRIVWAFLQHVTYKHYIPAVLGLKFSKKKGLIMNGSCMDLHDPEINPSVYHELAAAAFRSFHSMVAREFVFVNKNFTEKGFLLNEKYIFRPSVVECPHAFDDLFRGLLKQPAQKMDSHITTGLTNHFFEGNKTFGGDLEIFDILSGRDMGIPPYYKLRVLCGLKEAKEFADLKDVMTVKSIAKLKKLYTSVRDVGLFSGGMMEKILPGTLVGPTFQCIIGEQFYHFMRGDRFYYEHCGSPWSFRREQIQAIYNTSVAWMFCAVGDDVEHIQADTFRKPSSNNPVVPCAQIPGLDLSAWKDQKSN